MNRYRVFSQLGRRASEAEIPATPVLEVTRSDRKVAEQDVAIINDIFRRKAWLEDAEEVSRD